MLYDRKRYWLEHGDIRFETPEPINWEDDEKKFERHRDYHGITITLANGLIFTGSTRSWFIALLENHGVNADVRLRKEIRDYQTDRWITDYIAYADFNDYKITETTFECDFNANPLTTLFKSKLSAKVELETNTNLLEQEINPVRLDNLYLEGREILLTTKLGQIIDGNTMKVIASTNGTIQAFQLDELTDPNEGIPQAFGQLPYDYKYRDNWQTGELIEAFFSNNPTETYIPTEPITARVSARIRQTFKAWGSGNCVFKVRIAIYSGVSPNWTFNREEWVFMDYSGPVDSFPAFLDNQITDHEITLAVGEFATFQYFISGQNAEVWWYDPAVTIELYLNGTLYNHETYYYEVAVTMQQDTIKIPTDSKCIMIYEFAKRLNDIVLQATFKSNLFAREDNVGYTENGDFSDIALLHGLWARGIDSSDSRYKPIATSLKEFIESVNVVYPIGVSLNNGIFRIEERDYFYQKIITIKLGEVQDLEISPDKDSYHSLITVGYQKAGGYEEEYGLDEYNRETQYNTILNKTDSELKLLSKYRADSYGLETVRRDNILIDPTFPPDKDSKFDDHIWLLDVERDSSLSNWKLSDWQKRFAKAPENVYSPPTAWNLWFSPINIILRHGSWIKAGLRQYPQSSISFNFSEGNSNLKTQLIGGNEYSQDGSIPVQDLDHIAHKGMMAKFTCPILWSQLNGVTKGIPNVYGLTEFWRKGVRYRGFILGVSMKNGIGSFEVKLFS